MAQATSPPQIYVLAGPNGAGKTTFAKQFITKLAPVQEFLNADYIAQGIAPFSPQTAAIQASRQMLTRMN